MIDLKLVFNASYEEVSRSVSGRGAGGFVGALIGGILVDKFDRSLDLITALVETMAAAAVTYIPFAPDVGMLWFLCFILGACSGVANIGKKNHRLIQQLCFIGSVKDFWNMPEFKTLDPTLHRTSVPKS